jgi:O-antigen ligase
MELRLKFYEFSMGLTLLLQVLFPKLMPLGMLLFALSIGWLSMKREMKWFISTTHILFILFYFMYGVGCFFTQDYQEAAHVLESKLSFVLFPILFLALPRQQLNYRIPIFMYLGSMLLLFIYSVYHSFSCFVETTNFSCFISTGLSSIHHPTYMAIYYLVGGFLVIKIKNIPFVITLILLVIFSMGYLLCMSLSAILFLLLLIAIGGFSWLNRKIGSVKSVGIVILMLGSVVLLIDQSKDTIDDIQYTYNSLKNYLNSPQQFVKNANRYLVGNEERLVLWTVSTEAITEQPLGYGTGNVDIVLGAKLRDYGLNELAGKRFNPHNQFLQTTIEIGIVGLIVLIALYFTITLKAIRDNQWVLLVLVASFAFNSLFESLFQRQSGIVFFTFWVFILQSISNYKQQNTFLNFKP